MKAFNTRKAGKARMFTAHIVHDCGFSATLSVERLRGCASLARQPLDDECDAGMPRYVPVELWEDKP